MHAVYVPSGAIGLRLDMFLTLSSWATATKFGSKMSEEAYTHFDDFYPRNATRRGRHMLSQLARSMSVVCLSHRCKKTF